MSVSSEFNAYAHLTASGLVASGPQILHTLNVNTKAGVACAITVYDNTAASGNVIAVIDGTVNFGWILDVVCSTGIYISISAGTPDITVAYHKSDLAMA